MSTLDIDMRDLTATMKERMIRECTGDPKFRDMTVHMEDSIYDSLKNDPNTSVLPRNHIYWDVFEAVSQPFRFEGEGVLW